MLGAAPVLEAQEVPSRHASSALPEVRPPSERVSGLPGRMTAVDRECRELPSEGVRQRIVDVAVGEWIFFGSPVVDHVDEVRLLPPGMGQRGVGIVVESTVGAGRVPLANPEEAARVAATIAGYWVVTPEGPGIVSQQNRAWNGTNGIGSRWVAPWSAAFVSWVMCEAGLASQDRFRRAIAHRSYIDQAIRARDGAAPGAAYVAYDIGEAAVEPGDLLCNSRRPVYRNLAERRRQMGTGASTHCDVVVKVDVEGERILAVGGNVLRSVSLKVLPARMSLDGDLRPSVDMRRPPFVHLKLSADPVGLDALRASRVVFEQLSCGNGMLPDARVRYVASVIGTANGALGRC